MKKLISLLLVLVFIVAGCAFAQETLLEGEPVFSGEFMGGFVEVFEAEGLRICSVTHTAGLGDEMFAPALITLSWQTVSAALYHEMTGEENDGWLTWSDADNAYISQMNDVYDTRDLPVMAAYAEHTVTDEGICYAFPLTDEMWETLQTNRTLYFRFLGEMGGEMSFAID